MLSRDRISLVAGGLDRGIERQDALGLRKMKALDHGAVEIHRTLVCILRLGKDRIDSLSRGDRRRRRREHRVADRDPRWINQGLAVESVLDSLAASRLEAAVVATRLGSRTVA